jgi:hypothetical protein
MANGPGNCIRKRSLPTMTPSERDGNVRVSRQGFVFFFQWHSSKVANIANISMRGLLAFFPPSRAPSRGHSAPAAFPPDLKDPHGIKWRLCHGVSKFCGVTIYRQTHQSGLTFIGLPSDAQFAEWLLNSLADFVFAALYEHLISCLAPKSERRLIIRSFTAACCDRISDRLIARVEQSKRARTSNGRELVVVKDAAIKAFMREHHIRLRSVGVCSPSNVDRAADAAGRAAGERATFGRPVTGAAGALRIGKS